MKALISALVFSTLTLGLSHQAAAEFQVPLVTGGYLTMAAGSGLLAYDIYKVRGATNRVAEAQRRLESSNSYRQFVTAQEEVKAAEAELERLNKVENVVKADVDAAQARVFEKEEIRNRYLGEVIDKDALRFDPHVEGKALGPHVEKAREKMIAKTQQFEAKVGKLKRLRRVGTLGLITMGGAIVFLTAEESSSGLQPSEVFRSLSRNAKGFVASELEPVPRWSDQGVTLEEILEESR